MPGPAALPGPLCPAASRGRPGAPTFFSVRAPGTRPHLTPPWPPLRLPPPPGPPSRPTPGALPPRPPDRHLPFCPARPHAPFLGFFSRPPLGPPPKRRKTTARFRFFQPPAPGPYPPSPTAGPSAAPFPACLPPPAPPPPPTPRASRGKPGSPLGKPCLPRRPETFGFAGPDPSRPPFPPPCGPRPILSVACQAQQCPGPGNPGPAPNLHPEAPRTKTRAGLPSAPPDKKFLLGRCACLRSFPPVLFFFPCNRPRLAPPGPAAPPPRLPMGPPPGTVLVPGERNLDFFFPRSPTSPPAAPLVQTHFPGDPSRPEKVPPRKPPTAAPPICPSPEVPGLQAPPFPRPLTPAASPFEGESRASPDPPRLLFYSPQEPDVFPRARPGPPWWGPRQGHVCRRVPDPRLCLSRRPLPRKPFLDAKTAVRPDGRRPPLGRNKSSSTLVAPEC